MALAIFSLSIGILYFSNSLLKINKQVPSILEQVSVVNDSISSYMQQAIALMDDAKKISQKAGVGATHGFIKGIITTPFALGKEVGNLAISEHLKISEDDFAYAKAAMSELLNHSTAKSKEIESKEGKTKINIRLSQTREKINQKNSCVVKVIFHVKKGKSTKKEKADFEYIRGDNKEWEFSKVLRVQGKKL